MRYRFCIGIWVVLWGVIATAFAGPHGQAHPVAFQEEALARFLHTGIFDPAHGSEDDLYAAVQAAYVRETDPAHKSAIAEKWLLLKWWRLWEADAEMPPEYILMGSALPEFAAPTGQWQWLENLPSPGLKQVTPPGHFARLHAGIMNNGSAQHGWTGTLPLLLPANGRLLQYVYIPDGSQPQAVQLRLKTGFLSTRPPPAATMTASWTATTRVVPDSENRPANFWAGTLPAAAGWHLLEVNLTDLGLNGRHRIVRGIEYTASGGAVWFGPTVIRRPPVEIRGARPYHVFEQSEPLAFTLTVHNFSATTERYRLELRLTDYAGNILQETVFEPIIAAGDRWSQPFTAEVGAARYVVCEFVLTRGGDPVFRGHTAAARIQSPPADRRDDSPFGMMYWEQPGRAMVELYRRLGVKLIGMFPELHRLHRFDPRAFMLMPMLWSLPAAESPDAQRLREIIQPYLEAGHAIFSNFWETDLRVPAAMFAPGMRQFSAIIKAAEPAALTGVGGLAWFNIAYLNQLFGALPPASGEEAGIDFVAAMSYTTPSPPEFSGIAREAAAVKALLQQRRSPQTEVWNVELAYFENLNVDDNVWLNTGVPRHLVAPYTIRHHLLGFGAGIDRMLPGTQIYAGRTPLAKNYGHSMTLGRSSVLRYDLSPLPMLPAYATMTRLLEGTRYRANLSPHPNVWCQVYQPDDPSAATVLAIWSAVGHEEIAIPLFADTRPHDVTVVNMIGEERRQTTFQGTLHLSASPEPQYVVLPPDVNATLPQQAVSLRGNLLFESAPGPIDIAPHKAQRLTLTYRIVNPGLQELRGTLRLRSPNWLTVHDVQARYPNDVQQQLADLMQISAPEANSADAPFWLGREHTRDITFAVEIPADIPRQAYYEERAITRRPQFPIVAEIVTDDGVMARAATTVRSRPPLEMTLRPVLDSADDVNHPAVDVRITNHSTIERSGMLSMKVPAQLRVTPAETLVTIPPGHTRVARFQLRGECGFPREYEREAVDSEFARSRERVRLDASAASRLEHYRKQDGYLYSFGIGEGYVIEALLRDDQGFEARQSRGFAFRPAVRASQPMRLDGQLDEWRRARPLFLHPEGRLAGVTFWAADYGGEMQWRGLDDFSDAWQMMWDDEALYLALRAWDDHVQPCSRLADFWNGDTISVQIDPRPDATDAGMLPRARDLWDIHTFEIALGEAGPVVRRKHPTHRHPAGLLSTIPLAVKRLPDGVVYELAIPWRELAPLSPATAAWMGVSMVFYEDDGQGREARVNWFGGSGGNGLAREPRLMGDVHCVP